jgi:hypothetical protein
MKALERIEEFNKRGDFNVFFCDFFICEKREKK